MKFELFGKLRDDGNSSSGSTNNPPPTSGNNVGGLGDTSSRNTPQVGSNLEENVQKMFSQGYSEEEIRQELQGQYSENEIDQAVNRTIKSSATGNTQDGPEPMTSYQGGNDATSPMDEGYGQENQNNMDQDTPPPVNQNSGGPPAPEENPVSTTPPANQGNNNQNPMNGSVNESVEEMVEAIVAENLERVEKEFENAYSEIDELKEKMNDIEERVHDLEVRDDEDQTQFIQKMDELEEDIDSYQARMGGLEKAFQQILPSLVDNVRDLTSLVQEIKQERGIETEANMSKEDIQDIDMEDW